MMKCDMCDSEDMGVSYINVSWLTMLQPVPHICWQCNDEYEQVKDFHKVNK